MPSSDKKKYVPLTMGPELIGKAYIDLDTGMMEAELFPDVAKLLNETLGAGLMSMSFYGTPIIPSEEAQRKFRAHLNQVNE